MINDTYFALVKEQKREFITHETITLNNTSVYEAVSSHEERLDMINCPSGEYNATDYLDFELDLTNDDDCTKIKIEVRYELYGWEKELERDYRIIVKDVFEKINTLS